MSDLLLDSSGDLDLSTNDFQLADGLQAIRQELQIRFRFFLGEWFLDPSQGVPYIESILKKNPTEGRVRSVLTQVALSTAGVEKVESYSAEINSSQRSLTVSIGILANIQGELVYEPFIIEVPL